MSLSSRVMNKSEEKIRKHWLFSTISLLILYPIALFAFLAALSEGVHIPEDALIEPLAYAFTGLFSLWLIWHCAYRKYGTGMLGFWLIVSPFKQLASIVEALKEPCNGWTIAFIALGIGVFLWWYLLSLKMRKVNKSIQSRLAQKKVQSEQVTS